MIALVAKVRAPDVTAASQVEKDTVSGDARKRIIDAGIQCIVRDGVARATMSAIAEECDVSKALLHYHFADRDELLASITTALGQRLTARERREVEQSTAANPIDALWQWVESELAHGELRALVELGTVREPSVRQALEKTNATRRIAAATTVDQIFASLGLTPRVSTAAISDACIAFIDGLALQGGSGERDPRVSFDVFWLAILSLGN